MPGVWGHLLTFLGGPHACIGYRFSITECVRSCSFLVGPPVTDVV